MHVVDGTFSQAALVGKIQIKEQLPKYLGGEVQLGKIDGYNVIFAVQWYTLPWT